MQTRLINPLWHQRLPRRRHLLYSLPAIALLAACSGQQPPPADVGKALWQTDPDALLQSARAPLALQSLQGKRLLVFFGYIHCPDVCPTNLGVMAQVLARLSPQERDGVRAVFITLDPQRDTPEVMRSYLGLFHPDLLGLRSAHAQAVAQLAAAFRVYYKVQQAKAGEGAYAIDHSAHTSLVDSQGRLVKLLTYGGTPDAVLSALRSAA